MLSFSFLDYKRIYIIINCIIILSLSFPELQTLNVEEKIDNSLQNQ